MTEIRELAKDTYIIDCGKVPHFEMPQVTYIVGMDRLILIEPGATTAAARLVRSSGELGMDLERVSHIIPTHIHVDHAGAIGYLAKELPWAKIVVHPRVARHVVDPARLIQATRMVFGADCEDFFGPVMPVPEAQVQPVADGQTFQQNGRTLSVYYTPGHAYHHISIMDTLTRGLFCGEALGFPVDDNSEIVLPAGIPPFDPYLYLDSIERLSQLGPEMLFFSHIGERANPSNRLIEEVRGNSRAFRDIVHKCVEEGKSDKEILQQLGRHLEEQSADPKLLQNFKFDPAGYIDYFRQCLS